MTKNGLFIPWKWNQGLRKGHIIEVKEFTGKNTHSDKFGIQCYNIGFGAATNVSINFSFDVDQFVNKVQDLSKLVAGNLIIDIENTPRLFSIEPRNEDLPVIRQGIAKQHDFQQYKSYILPVSNNEHPSEIYLPSIFLTLLNIYVHYIANIQFDNNFEPEVPPITTEIAFLDIAKTRRVDRFTIVTRLSSWGNSEYTGMFEILYEQ